MNDEPVKQSEDSDERWMRLALAEARAAAVAGDVPVGAVVVRRGELIGRGRNRREVDHDPTAHAEVVAIREASRVTGSWRLDDCALYVTLEPCAMCAGAVVLARLPRLIYGADDPKAGACGSVLNVIGCAQLNHRPEVIQGVLDVECAKLLKDFFAARR